MSELVTKAGRALIDGMIPPVDHEPPYDVMEAVRLDYRDTLSDNVLAIEDEARTAALSDLRPKVEKYAHHLYSCSLSHSEFPAPWDNVACTCQPRSLDSVHQKGCAKAAAFTAGIDAYDARAAARVCTCGFAEFLALFPTHLHYTVT